MDISTYFPKITYEGLPSRNLMFKIGLIKDLLKKYKIYYPYTVKDGERADTIAYDYYGDSSYEWLVCLPNNIHDLHSDWVKSYDDFYRYLITTYGDVETPQTTISHYKYTGVGDADLEFGRKTWKMSVNTFDNSTLTEQAGWTPVYVYDYEMELNESKREIILISNEYLNQINKELRDLSNA
ncbi:MAG: hypothetical protein COA52_00835 [Hyphomicrobiales bacterium]|nr:MAG: hypothetical protein COA52_00835 [Hyphomicrobiales bacterium]